jgi:hypothetical protein
LGGRNPEHELLAWPGFLRDDTAILEKYAAAMRGMNTMTAAGFLVC